MKKLLESLNIKYRDYALYEQALTHSSYANEHNTPSNERLEFLGDAVLELLMSEYLHKTTDLPEGEMTKRRAQAVREEALVIYSEEIELKNYLRLGHGEQQKGANDAIIADSLEAVFAAVYIDLGLKQARSLFNKVVVPNLNKSFEIKDYKSILQEVIHSGGNRNISYKITKETGPSHNKSFESTVYLDKEISLGVGVGKTKKEAEQNAAKEALKRGMYDFKKVV